MIFIWKLNVRDSMPSGIWVKIDKMLFLWLVVMSMLKTSVGSGNNFFLVLLLFLSAAPHALI